MGTERAVLLLEEGTRFEGRAFGARGEAVGETVFYTGVVGYQEVITSPSYRGTLAVLTYPIIGSYGINREDNESPTAQVSGVVIRDYSHHYSNFRATGALEPFLREQGVVGIQGIDTRALAVHLREHGEQRGLIASGGRLEEAALLERLRAAPCPFESDLLEGLPAAEPPPDAGGGEAEVVVLDLGVTQSLLAHLVAAGAAPEIVPANTAADDILAKQARGVVIAGGPGDPRVPTYAVETVKGLLGEAPILGIGLGCQALALALGGKVKRLKAGHHGVNHPVKQPATGRCDITVQHHSFVVDGDSLPGGVELTHVNLNDRSVEGIRCRDAAAVGVQFHPIPDEMGNPSALLTDFVQSQARA